MGYYGKYSMSKKAVDIELMKIEPITYQSGSSLLTLEQMSGGIPNNPLMSGTGGLDIALSQLSLSNEGGNTNSYLMGNSNLGASFIPANSGIYQWKNSYYHLSLMRELINLS